MDDLIERLQRDLLDLTPTPAPFDDLQKRVARRARRRRVGAGVVGVIVAAAVIAGAWAAGREGDGSTVPVNPGADAPADLLFLAGDGEAWVVDPARETARHLSMPELPPGDAPYRVVRRDDVLVAWAYRTLVLRPSADSVSSDVLVPDSLFFIPSSSPDRVWVGIVDEAQDDGRLTAVREVSIDGQVTVPDTRPPDGAWPVAAVTGISCSSERASCSCGTRRPARRSIDCRASCRSRGKGPSWRGVTRHAAPCTSRILPPVGG